MRTRARIRAAVGASLVASLLAACGTGSGDEESAVPEVGDFTGRGPISFVAGKDFAGGMSALLKEWNDKHPDEKVTFIELPEQADQQRQQYIQNAETQSDAYDVISVDVVWTSEFAAHRWIDPLPEDEFETGKMLDPVVEAAKYRGQLYGAPNYTDAGLLYYRTDLLRKAGFDEPPTTWDEMAQQCDEILELPESKGMSCYAGQFEKYEGLTVNFAESIQSAGGSIVGEDGKPALDTPEAKEGFSNLVDGFESGMIPKEAITYQEETGRQAFQKGDLVFHRQWPYQYALANADDGSSEVAGKFDVAPLPGVDGPGSSSLGGWNLAVSSFAKNKATALDFIKFMTTEEMQRKRLVESTQAPVYASLYEDDELIEQYPYLPELKESVLSAEPRPRVVRYGDTTAAIQDEAYAALTGEKSAEDALASLQQRLAGLVDGP
ncbi:ABC transporter substrate-binding protein [Haloechinothrix salitolerans]|uniref:ABC transporter substrate-binding protein n=1 Tax=Haloechinothrix salitolerans TaxID=926830 RepID=A0ABW2BSR3_9PSEU